MVYPFRRRGSFSHAIILIAVGDPLTALSSWQTHPLARFGLTNCAFSSFIEMQTTKIVIQQHRLLNDLSGSSELYSPFLMCLLSCTTIPFVEVYAPWRHKKPPGAQSVTVVHVGSRGQYTATFPHQYVRQKWVGFRSFFCMPVFAVCAYGKAQGRSLTCADIRSYLTYVRCVTSTILCTWIPKESQWVEVIKPLQRPMNSYYIFLR